MTRRSTTLSMGAAALLVWSLWLASMVTGDGWGLFGTGWFMSVTMAFGSFIAGATSEGGGAVAFPVMTLVFGIAPPIARDFSLMIQSVGMTAATATILYTGIRVEHRSLLWAGLGGAVGIVLGLEFVAGLLPPAFAKLFFTSTWLAFGFALYNINRFRDREVHLSIRGFSGRTALLLFATGIVGGVVSSITGSGLDITVFSLLVLRLGICEKVATPTSVILMASNAVVGFAWKTVAGGGMAPEAWNYWWVCVPVVVVGAPLGAWFIRDRSRHFVSGILYVSILTQFVGALIIIPLSAGLAAFSAAVITSGVLFFRWMAAHGVRRMAWIAGNDAITARASPWRRSASRAYAPEDHR